MNLFKRVKNIITSNLNCNSNTENFIIDDYEEVYYNDSKDIPESDKIEEKYYKILELEYGAGFSEIKQAYRKLLKKYHPDMFQNDLKKSEIAKQVTQQLNEAYNYFERKYL